MGLENFTEDESPYMGSVKGGMLNAFTEPPSADGDISEFAPLHQLLWDLSQYGFPIAKDTVDLVIDYLDEKDKPIRVAAKEIDHKTIAQALKQRHEELDFETNNEMSEELKEHMEYLSPTPY